MRLINHTNHPSTKWEEKQKEGFKEIIDLQFPNISPQATTEEVKEIASENFNKIKEIVKAVASPKIAICLQGEFTYCYLLRDMLKEANLSVLIPTTERKVVENGNTKIATFEFVQWRKVG